jgi:HK97 family phage prohead protease
VSGITYGAPQRIAEVKAAGDGWEVSGFPSTFGQRDLGNDVVHKGAFARSLAAGQPVRFLYAHDASQVLGTTLELRETDEGLFGRFRISKTRLGEDVRTLLHDKALDSFSIGFIARDFDFDEGGPGAGEKTRNLKGVELLECSLVAMPMNPAAVVTGIKAWQDVYAMSGTIRTFDYEQLPLERLLDVYDTHRTAALEQAKAVAQRRLSEGRKLSDTTLAVLERLRALSEEDAAELLRLSTTPPTQAPRDEASPAPAEAVGSLVDAHLRRARLRELSRMYGVTTP